MGNEDTYDYIVRLEFIRLTLEALVTFENGMVHYSKHK